MNDGFVTLLRRCFTKEDWQTLAMAFGFDEEQAFADIHVVREEIDEENC